MNICVYSGVHCFCIINRQYAQSVWLCVCVFQYAADAQDKQWLAEKQHMRATGGKMVRVRVYIMYVKVKS